MQEENVAGESFAAWRAAEEQRDFAIGLRVFGEIVVESYGVALRIAEIFAHGAGGEWGEVLHRRGLGGGCCDYDGVFHRAGVSQNFHYLRDGGALLADGAVNAN